MFASTLKEKFRQGDITVGGLMMMNFWPGFLEIYEKAGMDFVMLDLEHGSCAMPNVEELCRTARLLDLPLLVRPVSSLFHLLRRYVDMGPSGFIMPWIERQEQVDTLRQAIFMPPKGRRGGGGPSVFAISNIERSGWDEFEENVCVVLMVESPQGVEAIQPLAALDWVDAVMIGPYDLAMNLGHVGQLDHPDVIEAILRVFTQVHALGKPVGMPVGTIEQARFWQEHGCRFFLFSETTTMVRTQSEQFLKEIGA